MGPDTAATNAEEESGTRTKYYFVDESGDSTLFHSKGGVAIGQLGCSRFFIIGLLDIPNEELLIEALENLRTDLLSDPYFDGVPSFDPKKRKTAVAFHAKDDVPEVRREVFRLLRGFEDLRFFAVIRDKFDVLDYVHNRQRFESSYRYNDNELYDYMVRRLFRDRLHKDADRFEVCFAKRGSKDRTEALEQALHKARENFYNRFGIKSEIPINTSSRKAKSKGCGGLQAVDYFLWALQRLYERQEERYIEYLWPLCSLVMDIDDQRNAEYGEYYTKKKPLNLAALEGRL
jgi:hypothetical protein